MVTKHNESSRAIEHILSVIRLPPFCGLLGVSTYTVRRWVAAGEFPRPFRTTAESPDMWRVRDVEA